MRSVILGLLALIAVSGQPADTIYHNGKFITVNPSQPVAQAVAIRGNRFVAVGSNADVLKTRGPATKVTDLKGLAVVPGLVENHVHPIGAALAEEEGVVPTMHSIPEILA